MITFKSYDVTRWTTNNYITHCPISKKLKAENEIRW